MTIQVSLPAYLTVRGVIPTMRIAQKIRWANDNVEIDAKALKYADPFGMAVLGACFNCILRQGMTVSVKGLDTNIRSYLDRMNLFEGVNLESANLPTRTRHDRSDSLVELCSLQYTGDVEAASSRLAKALIGRAPGANFEEEPDEMTGYKTVERLIEPLQYVFSELLENALTHARRAGYANARVWVASQYYPKSDRIAIGVVDNGCGFLATLKSHSELTSQSHHAAILAALKPRVSCNRDLGIMPDTVNQGVGLTMTSRIVAEVKGKLLLVSGNAIHDTENGESGSIGEGWSWGGVAIAIECQRAHLSTVQYRKMLPPLDDLPPARLRFE